MGKEKRLLLLAVMTVLISTAGYGKIPEKIESGKEYINSTSEIISLKTNLEVTGTLINNESGKIEINNKGIIAKDKGNINNNGLIIVNGKGTVGIQVTGANAKLNTTGDIKVFGEGATGIYAYNTSGKSVENKGNIFVGGANALAQKGSSGMKAYGKNSEAVNIGIIKVFGDDTNASNAMIAQNNPSSNVNEINNFKFNGKVRNEGFIEVSGGAVNGMSASAAKKIQETSGEYEGKYVTVGNTVTIAENRGEIVLKNKATGINTGIIKGNGVGAIISDSIFINSGKINVENGIAIKSIGILKNELRKENGIITKKDRILNNTVYLKDGSEITGKILGAEGVDVLTLGKGNHEGLNVGKYEAITTREGDVSISNSTIALEYNKGTNDYLTESKNKLDDIDKKNNESNKKNDETGNLLLKNSNLIIDLKNKKVENPSENILGTMINVDNNKDIILENVKFAFKSNKENKFDISTILNDATDGKITNDKLDYLGSSSTAIWTYSKDKKGNWYATKKTFGEASKSQVDKFAQFLDEGKLSLYTNELQFLSQKEFDKGMAQLSGGLHGYTVDIAAVNSRTLSNTMRERALTRDYLIKRPVSSWIQDISYIDNNHRFGGLMDVKYNEKGVIGISEKQILSNGKLGLVYGGSSGKADAEDNGNIDVDTAYFGGYYNHEFNDKWSLNSNANFVYTHNRVTRNVKIGNLSEEVFKANYPTYTVGMGSSLVYTLKDDLYNKAYFYAGIDVNRIMQGMITEDEDKKFDGAKELAVRKNGAANDKSYYSIVPSAGFMVQNTGYIFDKKYRIGADLNWETEVGNIKDGKRLHMKGITDEYKVGTTERENIFSYSLFGALNLTEDLAVNTKYTSKFSDEYNADMISAGFEYKMDTMGDNGIFGPIFYGIENNKPMSDRWGGTLSLMMETLDDTDRTYYGGGKLNGGDYATSTIYKPKFTLSLNDKKSNLGYYFEGYYQNNKMLQGMKSNEAKMHASRIHGEVRWTDTYSKGKYGINIGYRHEESDKPQNFNQTYYRRTERKVHQLRLTPNFTYELGNGFTFTGKTTGIFEYNYAGDRDSQMDFLMENEYGIVYTGFMPKWRLSLIYFRDDRWYDNSNRKVSWNSKKKEYFYDYNTSGRYQLGQIRPTVIYYFGNGGSFKFDTRIPLGNGQWYDDKKGNKSSGEAYEVRYGFNYYHPVTSGLTMNVGGTFLNIKNKAKNGDITRSYSFRPNIGFSYSF